MIFFNPAGAPELACDECGCRWFDRMNNRCYECGAEVSHDARDSFRKVLEKWGQSKISGGRSESG
jgi:predicted amidophosphoribosyltransferase